MKSLSFLLLILMITLMSSVHAPATMQAAAPERVSVQTSAQADGVLLEWNSGSSATVSAHTLQALDVAEWPLVEIGGWQLPAYLVPLRITDAALLQADALPGILLEQVESVAWAGEIAPVAMPIPQTVEGEQRPALQSAPAPVLPSAPVVILREGWMRGERIIVVALTPIFTQDGSEQAATQVRAKVPGTALFDGTAVAPAATPAGWSLSSGAGRASFERVWERANRSALKITVRDSGIQQITGAMLAEAGLNLDTLDPAHLHIWHHGQEIAIETWGTDDSRLDTDDQLRFYAPAPGDRWNATDTYWLTVEETPGVRMQQRDVLPDTAPVRTSAFECGTWRNNTLYDSTLPGPDGDHWFAANLRTNPTQSTPAQSSPDAATVDVSLTSVLPSAEGTTVVTVTGSTYTPGTHQLTLQMGETVRDVTWSGGRDWSHTFFITSSWQPDIRITLQPGNLPSGVLLDSVTWQRPARLATGGDGIEFTGAAGTWHYQVSGLRRGSTLYDVSTPATPVRLVLPDGATPTFEDGPTVRNYIVAGSGTLHIPDIATHTAVDLTTPLNAEVLYIAPTTFYEALEPLLQLRERQGYRTAVIDVQAIYDTWSYGQVDPDAIRNFLRYAAATWESAPLAVTLVGDGTSDPFNYEGYAYENIIPPYLAMVDPWIGEVACETCYVQLDGDNPLTDLLPDMLLGRLPVNNVAELETVVAKITGYETDEQRDVWQSRVNYITDNFREASGQIDGAGNFHAFADASAELQPPAITIGRVYYDPSFSDTATWFEADAVDARRRTLDAFSDGAAFVNYVGHGFYWQWAVTDPSAERPYLLSVNDIPTLTNADRLPVILEMTCLTGGFQRPLDTDKSVDEQLLLHGSGGGVAVWGSSGFGVDHGHDWLQHGFYEALWKSNTAPTPPLGELVIAGYLELFTQGVCCQDALQTYLLMGDPLTVPRVSAGGLVYLPLIQGPQQVQ